MSHLCSWDEDRMREWRVLGVINTHDCFGERKAYFIHSWGHVFVTLHPGGWMLNIFKPQNCHWEVAVVSLCRAFQGSLCVWIWGIEIKAAKLRLRENFGKSNGGMSHHRTDKEYWGKRLGKWQKPRWLESRGNQSRVWAWPLQGITATARLSCYSTQAWLGCTPHSHSGCTSLPAFHCLCLEGGGRTPWAACWFRSYT